MKLSVAEKAVIGIALLAAAFTIGFFAGRSGGDTFVVETERQVAQVSEAASDSSVNTDASRDADASEAEAEDTTDVSQESGSGGLININTADSELLQTLPGIGEKIAGRIIAYREEHGDFVIIDEIMDVDGIGEKIFENIEAMITVD